MMQICEIKDPEIFIALKRLCEFLVNDAWQTSGDDEYDYLMNKTRQYERDVEMLASIDLDVGWGQIHYKTQSGMKVGKKVGDQNPWYEGDLKIEELLSSIEPFYELETSVVDLSLLEVEFTHYYEFLRSKLPSSIKTKKTMTIDINSLHPKILDHCKDLYRNKHYADAIFKAYKVIFNELKVITDINDLDGKQLAEKAFSLNSPLVKLNHLQTQSEKDEQLGFMMLFSGAALGIRNPKAHDLINQTDELKTLQYLSFASLLITKLEERV